MHKLIWKQLQRTQMSFAHFIRIIKEFKERLQKRFQIKIFIKISHKQKWVFCVLKSINIRNYSKIYSVSSCYCRTGLSTFHTLKERKHFDFVHVLQTKISRSFWNCTHWYKYIINFEIHNSVTWPNKTQLLVILKYNKSKSSLFRNLCILNEMVSLKVLVKAALNCTNYNFLIFPSRSGHWKN